MLSMGFGSISAYTQMLKKQYQWDYKKSTGDYTKKDDIPEDPILRQMEELRQKNQNGLYKESILSKLQEGKVLSPDELEYLRREDPEAYLKAKEIQMEKERYERELKNCRTKEDVQRLKTLHMGITMAKVNSIANDPNISKEKKMELLIHENARVKAICEAERTFIKSGQYSHIPSEAEIAEKEKEQEAIKEEEKSEKKEQNPSENNTPVSDTRITPQTKPLHDEPKHDKELKTSEASDTYTSMSARGREIYKKAALESAELLKPDYTRKKKSSIKKHV